MEPCSEGGYNVGWIDAGEWMNYTINVAAAGTYDIEARVAADAVSGGTFHIEFNGVDKTGTMTVSPTGSWQTWTTIKKSGVSLPAGTQVMRFVFDTQTGYGMNLNYIKISASSPPPAGDTTPPSTPGGLIWRAPSSTQINLGWTASTDNVGVGGYRIYRDGKQIATTAGTKYADKGLSSSTVHTYTVSAYDAAGNASPQSSPVSAKTRRY
jgi:hypothetical protein